MLDAPDYDLEFSAWRPFIRRAVTPIALEFARRGATPLLLPAEWDGRADQFRIRSSFSPTTIRPHRQIPRC